MKNIFWSIRARVSSPRILYIFTFGGSVCSRLFNKVNKTFNYLWTKHEFNIISLASHITIYPIHVIIIQNFQSIHYWVLRILFHISRLNLCFLSCLNFCFPMKIYIRIYALYNNILCTYHLWSKETRHVLILQGE